MRGAIQQRAGLAVITWTGGKFDVLYGYLTWSTTKTQTKVSVYGSAEGTRSPLKQGKTQLKTRWMKGLGFANQLPAGSIRRKILVSRVQVKSLDTHAALHVLQLWQDVQSEAVGLSSRTIPSVHEVAKSQHEAEDPQNTGTALESLEPEANESGSQS